MGDASSKLKFPVSHWDGYLGGDVWPETCALTQQVNSGARVTIALDRWIAASECCLAEILEKQRNKNLLLRGEIALLELRAPE
jgi:hypothetical protein